MRKINKSIVRELVEIVLGGAAGTITGYFIVFYDFGIDLLK